MSGLFNRLQDEIDSREQQKGLSPTDLLDMPSELAAVVQKIIRQNGIRLVDLAESLELSQQQTQSLLTDLIQKGYVRQIEVQDEVWYKAYFKRKEGKSGVHSVWSALDKLLE